MANTYLQTSTFPYENCYLDLDPEVRDPLGDPVCRITTGGPKQNEDRAVRYAQKKMEQWFREAGAIAVEAGDPGVPALTTHAYGGTRMGDDPETNVVDRWGFSHEAPNLGHSGRFRDGNQRRPQSDADRAGAGMAHRRTFGEELEINYITTPAMGEVLR